MDSVLIDLGGQGYVTGVDGQTTIEKQVFAEIWTPMVAVLYESKETC